MARINPIKQENYEYYQIMARNIRYYRRMRHLSQKELADIIDCSDKLISRWENDITITPCSMENFFSVARALEISPADLLIPLGNCYD